MNDRKTILVSIAIIIVLIFGLKSFFRTRAISSVEHEIREIAFKGIIQEIKKGDREAPIFNINDSIYSLGGYGHSLSRYASAGDSVKKEKGSRLIHVYKLNNNDSFKIDVLNITDDDKIVK
jgi:hypothetical protein